MYSIPINRSSKSLMAFHPFISSYLLIYFLLAPLPCSSYGAYKDKGGIYEWRGTGFILDLVVLHIALSLAIATHPSIDESLQVEFGKFL